MTELRRRMLEELRLRNYSPHTERAYIRCLANFAKHFGTAPDRLGPEHIRDYQLFLVQQKKLSWSPFNQTVCALRFFYHDVLHRKWMIEHIPYPRHEQCQHRSKSTSVRRSKNASVRDARRPPRGGLLVSPGQASVVSAG
jgi:hypothetical protein